MNRKLRNYFFGPQGSAYSKFSKQNEPTEARFKELFESQAFIAEVNDTAKTNEQGLIKIDTDADVIARTLPAAGAMAEAVQGHQLPELVSALNIGTDTVDSSQTLHGLTIKEVTRQIGAYSRRIWNIINDMIFTSSDGTIGVDTTTTDGTVDLTVNITSSGGTITPTKIPGGWNLETIPGIGPSGEDIIGIVAPTERMVACDSAGTVTGAYPVVDATLYEGHTVVDFNTIDLLDPTEFNPVATNCTATYSYAGTDLRVTFTGISADSGNVNVAVKYLGGWYYKKITISKVRGGVAGTTWVYKGELVAAPANPVEYWWYKNPNTLITYFYEGGTWKILLEGRDDGPTEFITLTNAGLNIALTNADKQDQIIHVPAGVVLGGPITISTAGTFSDGYKFNITFDGGFVSTGQVVDILGFVFNSSQCALGNVQVQVVYSATNSAWNSLIINPTSVMLLPIVAIMTKAQANAAVAAGTLTQCGFYLIRGVHPSLYDDGTTSGTEIILQATDKNQFSHKGYGKFYNPKYNQAVSGFGIWHNRHTWTATLTGGTFDANEAITADNGATGFLVGVLADNLFIATAGNWAAATSITGDVTGATATLAGITLKTYTIGQKVIWGHYAWENVNGNVGAATDVLTLDAEWLKLPYSVTDYNVTWDEIEFDFVNNFITSRYESEADNRVTETYATFGGFGYTYHAISVFQWGNHYNNSSGKGVGGNKVDESYAEFCNFQGSCILYNNIEQRSYVMDNLIIGGSYLESNTIQNRSYIYSNILVSNSKIWFNKLSTASNLSTNSLSNSAIIQNNTLKNSSNIIGNILNGDTFVCITAEKAAITIASAQVATFYPIFAATYTKNIISTVDAKNVLITWSAIGVSTPLDLATGVTPV